MFGSYAYRVAIAEQGDGSFLVTCPDVPEVLTEGSSREEALAEARDALEEAVAGRIRLGEDLPEPLCMDHEGDHEEVQVPPIMAAKAALSMAMRRAGTTQVALARQLGVDEKEVRRLLDPRHPSKLTSLNTALRALDQEVELLIVSMAPIPEILEAEARSYLSVAADAEKLAAQVFPDEVRRGETIPVQRLVLDDDLSQALGLPVDVTTDPGLRDEGESRFVGDRIVLTLRVDIAAKSRQGSARARFTIAHELAHARLHHEELRSHKGRAFRDANCTPTQKLPANVPIYRSPEWQANAWAGAFLMPAVGVRAYIGQLAATDSEFDLTRFAAHFQVSVQAARVRVDKLLPRLVSGVGGGEMQASV
jgi:antitoxin HicB